MTKSGFTFCINDTPGEKGTIIAVHGLTGNHKQFHHYQTAFTGTYRIVSYDLRGRGNSDPAAKGTSIYTHVEDLIELIETLNIKRPILMGYSMGAYICAIVASKLFNVEALILLDGAGEADNTSRKLVIPSLNRLHKEFQSVEKYVEEMKSLYTNLKVSWTETMEEIVSYDLKKTVNSWTHKSDPVLIEHDFESFYTFTPEIICSNITSKTILFIATGKIGDKAPLFRIDGYEKTRKHIRDLKTHEIHINHYELVFNKQLTINGEISRFLEEVK